jgi:hypothetical protein
MLGQGEGLELLGVFVTILGSLAVLGGVADGER